MNEREWEKQLHHEGFGNIFVCRDRPNAYYPEHTHAGTTAHIVLEGEITITSEGISEGTSEGTTRTFRAGERFDVPANAVHSARIGPAGCRYMVGEK